jgi:hypothetical protein
MCRPRGDRDAVARSSTPAGQPIAPTAPLCLATHRDGVTAERPDDAGVGRTLAPPPATNAPRRKPNCVSARPRSRAIAQLRTPRSPGPDLPGRPATSTGPRTRSATGCVRDPWPAPPLPALPIKRDWWSKRRGAQRFGAPGPGSSPTPDRDLASSASRGSYELQRTQAAPGVLDRPPTSEAISVRNPTPSTDFSRSGRDNSARQERW